MQGWISLHRKIMDHKLFNEPRKFSRFEAFVHLLMLASHKRHEFLLGYETITLEEGQLVTSMTKLAKKWNWSRGRVKRFLDWLDNEQMIDYKTDTQRTLINVRNYRFYQSHYLHNEHPTDTQRTPNSQPTNTFNNGNNGNNGGEVFSSPQVIKGGRYREHEKGDRSFTDYKFYK